MTIHDVGRNPDRLEHPHNIRGQGLEQSRFRDEQRQPHHRHYDALRYEQVSYTEALTKRLQVMDSTAFSLCMDNKIPIIVFDMNKPTNIRDAVLGKKIGTLVSE